MASTALALLCITGVSALLGGASSAYSQAVSATNGAQVAVPSASFPATTYSSGAFGQFGYILFSTGVNAGTPSLITGSGLTMATGGDRAFVGRVEANGQIVLSNSSLTTTGSLANALSADVGTITGTNLAIVTRGPTSSGAVAANGSTITLTGGTIDTSNANSMGLNSTTGSTVTASDVAVTGVGIGINAETGAQLNFTGGSIATSGTGAHGAVATTGGTIMISSATINTTGQDSTGLAASGLGSSILASSIVVNATNFGSFGVGATDQAQITINGGTITSVNSALRVANGGSIAASNVHLTATGGNALGVFADNGTINMTGGSITALQGSSDHAFNASNSALLQADGVIVNASGNGVNLSSGAQATFKNGTIDSVGSGVSVKLASKAEVSNTEITTTGDNGFGLHASNAGSSIIATAVRVTTSGANAHGAVVDDSAMLSLSNSELTANGDGASGLSVTGPAASTQTASLTQVTLASPHGASILATGGTANVAFNNSTAVINNGLWLHVTSPDATNPTVANITIDPSTISGAAITDALSTSNVSLIAGSVWTMTGNSNVTNLTNDASLIGYTPPVGDPALLSSYKTLTTQNYFGQGGTLAFNTFLGADGSPSDMLVIDGGTATGNTTLAVRNATGPGALTLSDGIKVVDATNGGTTADASFVLRGNYVTKDGQPAVVGGAYAYTLFHNGVTDPADSDWYLRSQIVPTPPGPTPPPPPKPRYQPGVPLYEVYPQHLLALNTVPTLQQRVGNRYWNEPAPETVFCKDASKNFQCPVSSEQAQYYAGSDGKGVLIEDQRAIWGRIEGSHISIEPASTTSGTDYDTNVWRLQAGLDGLLHEAEDGSKLIGGVTVHLGQASSDVTSFFGDGDIDTTGGGFGGTLTWYDQNGFYVDGQASLTWFNSDLTSKARGLLTPTLIDGNGGFGYALSIETGKKIDLNDSWAITPQAQLIYANVDFSSFTDVFGANISLGSGDSLIGRLGISADRDHNWKDDEGKTRRRHLYGIANIYYQMLDATQVDVSGTSFETRPDRLWGGLGLGGSYNWDDDKYSLYGEVSVNSSLENFGDSYALAGTAGFRVKW